MMGRMTSRRPLPRSVDVLIVGGGATGAGLLRDLARRGLRSILVDKGDLASGTSGRYHGLLHSGARYIARDPQAARECIVENRVLRRIAPACIEDTGGVYVATPDDPDDYVDAFPARCAAVGIPCDEESLEALFQREPALNRRIRRGYRIPDASLEPWQLVEANLRDAAERGSEALPYRQVVGMERTGSFVSSVSIADVRSGTIERIAPRIIVSAAGAWAGRVAGLAGIDLPMSPGKGTMLVYNQRMTDTVISRCKTPSDGDIMVPVHTVAILGTTDIPVDDPDDYEPTPAEIEALIDEGEKLFPDLRRMRILRAYAGVRPLYAAADVHGSAPAGRADRGISRAHAVIDHEPRDGVTNFVSIVGGKLTTYRLMAEQTADVVCAKLGISQPCTTADEVLPGEGDPRGYYWLGDRLAATEATGGGDAALICECEFVTRPMLEAFLADRMPCSLDDVRRSTRLGMGPCQGAFCTFRAAGLLAALDDDGLERAVDDPEAGAEDPLVAFLRERYRGIRPIAWGRQLQELWLSAGIYQGVLGVDALVAPGATVGDGPG
jgi:glycerol-3-phosphate dehydrogenase